MKYNIVLVGAGQLGSRYLQGLSKFSEPLSIFVIDVNQNSLDNAQLRWREALIEPNFHSIKFQDNMENLPEITDIAIISTSSNVRELVVKNLMVFTSVKNWILEKVLTQNITSLNNFEFLLGKTAWVNTFFRTLPWFKEIKKNTSKSPIHVEVTGGNWGIACNTIHFLDFIHWWTGENILSFDHSGLESKWQKAKRIGFWEINGCLVANFSNGSTATLKSDDSNDPFLIKIKSDKEEWEIDWDNGIAKRNDDFTLKGKVLYQSEMTSNLVESILYNNDCELPTISVSIQQHKPFLESLLSHWNNVHNSQIMELPIT
jgi:hypothetical protein